MHERPTLGDFLRARRERLQPSDVGLPTAGRRRTPGLRREELATLAGVSADYLVRLEQGRDRNPSGSVLGSVAAALRLDDDERAYLFELASIGRDEQGPASRTTPTVVPPAVRHVVDRLEPTPAFACGITGDVLAHNHAWEVVARPLGMLDAPVPNLIRYTFANPRAKEAYPDWPDVADGQVAALRTGTVRGPTDLHDALIRELMSIPEFAARWAAYEVGNKCSDVTRILHPDIGELRFTFQALLVPEDPFVRVASWLPADTQAAEALDRVLSRPAQPLRLVRDA